MYSDSPPFKDNHAEEKRLADPQLYKDRILNDLLYARIDNRSGRKILIYGPKVNLAVAFDNQAYIAPSGWQSPAFWDFDGFFLPAGSICKIKREDGSIRTINGPGALKYKPTNPIIGAVTVITTSNGELEVDVEPNDYLGSDDVNWFIPDGRKLEQRWTQADVNTYTPINPVPDN